MTHKGLSRCAILDIPAATMKALHMCTFVVFISFVFATIGVLEMESTRVTAAESGNHPDVVIKLIKREVSKIPDATGLERDKRKSSSKKNKGRKIGK